MDGGCDEIGNGRCRLLHRRDGCADPLREMGTQWSATDTMCALGYYVPASQERIDIQFLPQLEGYIWIFPRCGHFQSDLREGRAGASLRGAS